VWARFSYSDTSFTTLELMLVSPSGVIMASREAEFQGNGSEAWEITGDSVARGLAGRMAQAALTAQDNARRAATQQHGVTEYLAGVASAVGQMRSTSNLVLRMPVDFASRSALVRLGDAIGELSELLLAAQALPIGDIAGRQEYARQMAAPAGRAVIETRQVEAAILATDGLPMPPTQTGTDELDAHTVTVRVNGSAARSASIWFFDGSIYLPSTRTVRR
jgi:hypothetical protein